MDIVNRLGGQALVTMGLMTAAYAQGVQDGMNAGEMAKEKEEKQ